MKTKILNTSITNLFYEVAHEKENINVFVDAIKVNSISAATKYAYQSFCCALLAKQATGLLQKGKYIKEYGFFIQKAFLIDDNCLEAHLIRLMVEKRLEKVSFTSFANEDIQFLTGKLPSIEDQSIRELILKAISNE
jgi:hypothetical protein